jgi:hypothetical protein
MNGKVAGSKAPQHACPLAVYVSRVGALPLEALAYVVGDSESELDQLNRDSDHDHELVRLCEWSGTMHVPG